MFLLATAMLPSRIESFLSAIANSSKKTGMFLSATAMLRLMTGKYVAFREKYNRSYQTISYLCPQKDFIIDKNTMNKS
jgi:hypothetical protein